MENPTPAFINHLPTAGGISLKPEHFDDILKAHIPDLWFEVHTENYFVDGGLRLAVLERIRQLYPLSFHGVGASLGGVELPSAEHLKQVKALVDRFEPHSVSEHAVWSQHGGEYFAELLPLPRTHQALNQLVAGINAYQEAINRPILIENPTNYLNFVSEMDEADFLVEAAQKSGCGLLLDINNLYLSAHNCGIDPIAYIQALPPERVGEIHIAGHVADEHHGDQLLIDSHAHAVASGVWQLLDQALAHLGPKPVLLERDGNIPTLQVLLAERDIAQGAINTAQQPLSTSVYAG